MKRSAGSSHQDETGWSVWTPAHRPTPRRFRRVLRSASYPKATRSSPSCEALLTSWSARVIAFVMSPVWNAVCGSPATGVLQGGYFFEGNLPVTILDSDKNPTKYGPGHGTATTDWMTGGPVSFYIDFDFTNIPSGSYYIKLTQDDPSGGESGIPVKSVIIPVYIKNPTKYCCDL